MPFARECRLGVWFGFVGAALLPAVGLCVVLAFGAMPGRRCFLRVTQLSVLSALRGFTGVPSWLMQTNKRPCCYCKCMHFWFRGGGSFMKWRQAKHCGSAQQEMVSVFWGTHATSSARSPPVLRVMSLSLPGSIRISADDQTGGSLNVTGGVHAWLSHVKLARNVILMGSLSMSASTSTLASIKAVADVLVWDEVSDVKFTTTSASTLVVLTPVIINSLQKPSSPQPSSHVGRSLHVPKGIIPQSRAHAGTRSS